MKRAIVWVLLAALLPACGGGSDSGPAPAVTVLLKSQVVDGTGATLTVTDAASPAFGTEVVVPAGALAAPTAITISQVSGGGIPTNVLQFELGPSGTTFTVPVTVTLKYLQQYLTDHGIADPATLHAVVNSAGGVSETLGTLSQDTVNHTLTTETKHFSTFTVLGYTNATLSGAYTIINYHYEDLSPTSVAPWSVPFTPFAGMVTVPITPPGFTRTRSTVIFNGYGNYSISESRNMDGVITNSGGAGTYSVAADGTLLIDGQITGSVLADGSTLVFTDVNGLPEVGFGIRTAGTFSDASLSGLYTIINYHFEGASQTYNAAFNCNSVPTTVPITVEITPAGFTRTRTAVTFDGAGAYSMTEERNTDGVLTTPGGIGSYSVAVNGTLSIDGQITGSVLAGGSTLVFTDVNGIPEVGVGIRKAGTFTNASLTGAYTIINYHFEGAAQTSNAQFPVNSTPSSGTVTVPIGPAGFTRTRTTVTFDGAGNYSMTENRNTDGVLTTPGGIGTYTVAADGTLSIDGQITGTVLDGGSTLVFTDVDGIPEVGVGIRR